MMQTEAVVGLFSNSTSKNNSILPAATCTMCYGRLIKRAPQCPTIC